MWVEEYKNIENQGFNFSPRFTCKYENGELTIEEKKDYISIFPDNINITAIVGENGSGKSAILSSMITKEKVFCVMSENNQLTVYSNNILINTPLKQKRSTREVFKKILYFSMDNHHLSLAKTQSRLTVIDLSQTNQLITENYAKLQTIDFSLFNFKPYYIGYEFINDWIASDYEFEEKDIEEVHSALGWEHTADTSVIVDTLRALRDLDNEYMIYLLNKFGTIAKIFEHIDLTEKLHPKDFYLTVNYEEIQEILEGMKIDFVDESEFTQLISHANKMIKIKKLRELFGENYIQLLFRRMIDELSFDYMAQNGSSYGSLSHGEKTLYSFFVNLVHFNNSDFLFLLDEPDNTLHPNWQKSFLNEMMNILTKLKKNAHLVITSHSPFLLSDIPKENVIFLEKGKQVYPNIETFGANIHTLLSHGFFMKEGLMGEFAKSKINEVIDYLNGKKSPITDDDEAQKYIHIIGEPIVKRQLQRMLDSKKLDKIKEIDELKNQIESLKNRLDILVNNS
ncbi:AAA family ATPase [Sulfurospirillum sp. MES]|uniref:AAA family ATPase n=1 Tax=Sulfurospirillum sp. MES TaxID=1565314 RepID=UPI000543505D|nr:AAA family ATPase [Sulfurospirillum sp. MES]KHG34485.1 MAG: hypothetical protein OA34_05185 [Sulfurospirillum sp. MES]